jgi:hypothetical protein
MRKICLMLLLLLSACGSKEGSEARHGAEADDTGNLLANLQAGSGDPAKLQELIDRAMPAALPDAKNAQYRNLRAGAGGAACGEVAAKGKTDFRPFVVTPEAIAVLDATPRIAYDDPSDFFADAWIRWCATPAELQQIGPALQQAARTAGTGLNQVDAATPPDAGPVPAPPPSAPPAPPIRPKSPPPAPAIDSFLKSVQHNSQ